MEYRRLEAFCKVYECRSFSRAGEQLFLSQPTISAHVAALEKDLDVRLFDRMGRLILPTAAADVLYKHAQDAFLSLTAAKGEIRLLQERVAGVLELGGSTIPANYLLPGLLALFVKRYPEVTIDLRVGDTEAMIKAVLDGDLPLAVVGGQRPDLPELHFTPVLRDELVLIAAAEALPELKRSTPPQLLQLPWVLREQGSGTRKAFEQGLLAVGVDPRLLRGVISVGSTQAVLRCVKAGMGVAVTSRFVVREELQAGSLRIIPCPDLALERSFYCVRLERRSLFPAAAQFLHFLDEQLDALTHA